MSNLLKLKYPIISPSLLGKRSILMALVIALSISLLTFPYMRIVFEGNAYDWHVLACKFLQFVLMFSISYSVIRGMLAVKIGDERRAFYILFTIYLFVHVIVLFCIYPGGWRWDDVGVLNALMANPKWGTWQCYLTPIFYTVCMLTFPAPAFIVFVQLLAISGVMAHLGWRLNSRFESKLPALVLLLLALTPPLLNMDLYPLRNGLHAWLEVLVFFVLVDHHLDGKSWTPISLIVLALMSAIVCVWRTECMVFVLGIPFLFWMLNHGVVSKWVITGFTLCCVVFTGALAAYQMMRSSPDYSLTAYVPALPALAHQALEDGDDEFLEEFGKAYDAEVLDEAYEQGVTGEAVYWNQSEWPFLARSDAKQRDAAYYSLCRNVFLKAVCKYPGVFLDVRLNIISAHMNGRWSAGKTGELFSSQRGRLPFFKTDYKYNNQLIPELRSFTAGYMETDQGWSRWLSFSYSLLIPAILFIAGYIVSILHKPKLAFVLLVFNVHQVLIFLTSPAYIFMYYYSYYLGGLIIGVFLVFKLIAWLAGKGKSNEAGFVGEKG